MFAATMSLVAMLQIANAPAGETAAPTIAPANEEVCRRIPVTGSLVRKEKVCHTRAEWYRLAENGNGVARAVVETSTGRPWGY